MPELVGLAWLNTNAFRNYPLSQSATCVSADAGLTLPDSFIVDMKLAVPYISGLHPSGFHISSLSCLPQGFVLTVGYSYGGTTVPVVAATVPVQFGSFVENMVVELAGVKSSSAPYDFSQVSGFVTIGSVTGVSGYSGRAEFDVNAGRLESTVVTFGIRRISGIRVLQSGSETPVIRGQVNLASGSNHSIAVVPVGSVTDIRLNAVSSEGFSEDCGCGEVTLGPCIRTVNSRGPDAAGNFSIVGGDCVNVTGTDNGLSLSDTCAKPCCGCAELDVVNQDLEALRQQIQSLISQAGNLRSNMEQLQTTCLGSQFTPESCAPESSGCGG